MLKSEKKCTQRVEVRLGCDLFIDLLCFVICLIAKADWVDKIILKTLKLSLTTTTTTLLKKSRKTSKTIKSVTFINSPGNI